jgi:hypothetical protein
VGARRDDGSLNGAAARDQLATIAAGLKPAPSTSSI